MAYFIAEIGFNHEGDQKVAIEMIKKAATAGANAVKFQTFRAFDIALPDSDHYKDVKCGEMSFERHMELFNVAQDSGLEFISTPYSPWAVDLLEKVGVPAYKIASMDCTNKYLLNHVAQTKKPIYLSTGMASLSEISDSLDYLSQNQSGDVTLLHCISLYPAKAQDLNLNIIPFLRQVFKIPVGYSDHFPGSKACLAAAMLGAEVIETHFTLDSSKEGADHQHSVDPKSLKELISDINLINQMRGTSDAISQRPDSKVLNIFRRGVYASRNIEKGDTIEDEDFLFCRPSSDFSPSDLRWLKGRIVRRPIRQYQPISLLDV